jgi:beta-carotene 3-hydroxylase
MSSVVAFLVAFAGMEAVSYSLHRWVMHGPGMTWHASHHAPPRGRWERNDLFPLCFSVLGFGAFALAASGVLPDWAWWAAAGITAYGVAYLAVHELFIHRRFGGRVPDVAYLRWLRDAHRAHHVDGGEPYGMLLPLMGRDDRQRARSSRSAPATADDVLMRSRTRDARSRL